MSIERKLERAVANEDLQEISKLFEEIYYEYGKLVAYIISKYVGNKEDIEELTNDVFVKFSRVLFTIEYCSIKQYLATQAKNSAIDFLRKNTPQKQIEYVEEVVFGEADEDKLLYNELLDDMKKYLSEEEINIILLHAVYGYSFVEIAKRFGRPVTTVKSTYHRAIKKYRKEGEAI